MGAAYVFMLQADLWVEKQMLTTADRAEDDYFGYNVAVCTDTLVVRACDDQGFTGLTYVFSLHGGT